MEAAGRPAADRGARLESAAQWSETNTYSLTAVERDYLQEARRRGRRSRRLARAAVTAISALHVVACDRNEGWCMREAAGDADDRSLLR
jgi:hypothetical protein